MKRELALVLSLSLILISMHILGNAAGNDAASGVPGVGGQTMDDSHGDDLHALNPMLKESGHSGFMPEVSGEMAGRIRMEAVFNGSDMERRFLAIRVHLGDEGVDDQPDMPPHVPGEVIVKLRQGASFGQGSTLSGFGVQASGIGKGKAARSLEKLNTAFGVKRISRVFTEDGIHAPESGTFLSAGGGEGGTHGLARIYKLEIEEGADMGSVIAEYMLNPLVEYAEPNYIYMTYSTPSDTKFPDQWALAKMDSEDAWDVERGDSGIIIAIVDTGVDWDHPDLAGNIWNNTDEDCNESTDLDGNGINGDCRGYDFVDNAVASGCTDADCDDEDNDPMDGHGHGTHCSGIAAAVTNNSAGVAGVCWNCTIMPLRAGFKHPQGGYLNDDDIAQSLEYAVNNSADIISMSFGGTNSSLMQDAIDYAYSNGVILIAAAGNSDTESVTSSYPAAYDNVISVSATRNDDKKSSYSNYGCWVDVAAPGGEPTGKSSSAVLSTMVDDTYASWAGTSMACPHVAGLAGLILSRNASFSQEDVRKILKSSADPIDHDEFMGFGRVNMEKAMKIDAVPESSISSLSFEQVLEGAVDVSGTASGPGFINYSLSHGSGVYPSSWTSINDSSIQLVGGKLGTWDTEGVPDGLYTVLLRVYSSGGWSDDRVIVRVLNNGTICVSCDDCEYKINNYQNASLFFLDDDISAAGNCVGVLREGVTFNCDNNNITGSGEGHAISVEADNVSIKNCVLESFQHGIMLHQSRNASLKDNQLNGNGVGLFVSGSYGYYYDHDIGTSNTVDGRSVNYYFSHSNQIINLTNESGHLEVAYSDNVTMRGNSVFGDGIKLDSVTGSLIEDNAVSDAKAGIYIDSGSSGNNFTGNSISKSQDYRQGVYFQSFNSLENHMDQSNTVNSEPLIHFYDVTGTSASPISPSPLVLNVANVTNVGRIMTANSSFINISGFDISSSVYAIYAYESANLTISSNTIYKNDGGIILMYTDNSSVTDNSVNENVLIGILTGGSGNNTFTGNNVTVTSECYYSFSFFGIPFTIDIGGIGIEDTGSTVRWNNISGNNCSGISVVGDGNEVHGNTIDGNRGGLYVGGSFNNFTNNQIMNHVGGYGLFVASISTTYNHINQSNTVNGEPLYYFCDVHGTTADPLVLGPLELDEPNASNTGKITVINSSHINITDSNLSRNGFGIYILGSKHINILNSSVHDTEYGSAIQLSDNVSMRWCNITGTDQDGIHLYGINDLLIFENNLIGTAESGGKPVYSASQIELSNQGSGNFWGHTDPPYFIPGTDSNYVNITDSYPYGRAGGWLDGDPPDLVFIPPTIPDGNHTNDDWIFVNVSADENLTACLLAWQNTSENMSMSVIRDNGRTYCYRNVTELAYGWHYYRVYANDSARNMNATGTRSARHNSPPVISSASVIPHLLLTGENLSITASVSDPDNVSSVYYNISSDTDWQRGTMQLVSGSMYGASITVSSQPDTYNVSVFANDTLGAENETIIGVIEFREARSITLQFRDHAGNGTNMSLAVFDPADRYVRNSAENVSDFTFQVPGGLWDINLSRRFWMILHDADFIEDGTGLLSIDDVPLHIVTAPANKQFKAIIASESNLSFLNAHITVPYSGLVSDENRIVAYECGSWNISGRYCIGGAGGWGNMLDEGDDYSVDKARDIIVINASGFSAYAVGEEVPYCGNGVIDDPAEECDGGDKDDETCETLGYDYGTLECTGSCQFDTDDCHYSGVDGYPTASMQISDFPPSITLKQGGSKGVTIGVRNTGSANLTGVSLSASTDCGGCQAQTSPSSLYIPPGNTENFGLALSVSYTQDLGNFSLNLTATSSQQATASAQSSIIVTESGLLCVPSTVKCSVTGNLLECNPSGGAWETKEVCLLGCSDSSCMTLCTPGELRCSGSVLQQCKSDGSEWEDKEDCQHGCDSGSLACKTLIGIEPKTGDMRCSDSEVQQYIDGGWQTIEQCEIGCANSTCIAVFVPPIDFDFSGIILIAAVIVIIAGAGFFYYNTYMKEMSWEMLEHKWEVIETNSAELISNAQHFLDKKIRISGRISESIQDERGVMGSTLEDSTGKVLVFSNPPGPKGRVELTGFVGQNEFGEIFVEVESFKTDWLWFISILKSLKISEKFRDIRNFIVDRYKKMVKRK